MIKFKLENKGRISQEFGGSPTSNPGQYTNIGLNGHSGIDSMLGYDKPVSSDVNGVVYKVIYAKDSPSNWQGVYILTKSGTSLVEVCYGHLLDIYVKEGDNVLEGQFIGSEGNLGYVFSGGVQITPAMQRAGDKRGAHVHTSYRPVTQTLKKTRGKFHLTTSQNKTYKDAEGYCYEVIYQDNGYKGCVNPRMYLYKNSVLENIKMIMNAVTKLKLK